MVDRRGKAFGTRCHGAAVFLAAVALCSFSPGTLCAEIQAGTKVIVHGPEKKDNVNVRAEAKASSRIVSQVSAETTGLEATGRTNKNGDDVWIEIKYGKLIGWIHSRHVHPIAAANQNRKSKNQSEAPLAADPPKQDETSADRMPFEAGATLAVQGTTKGDKLNLRTESSSSSRVVVEILPDATGLVATGNVAKNDLDFWIEVSFGEHRGWVNRRFVRVVEQKKPRDESPNISLTKVIDPITDCDSNDTERRLRGCTQLIEHGELDEGSRAIAYSRRSDSHLERNELDQAIADRIAALKLDQAAGDLKQRAGEAYRLRGNQLQERNDLDGALKDYSEAIAIDSANVAALAGKVSVYLRTDKTEAAISELVAALKVQPNNNPYKSLLTELYVQRGSASFLKKKYDAAIADYSAAIILDTSNAMLFMLRSGARTEKNDLDALSDLTQAIQLNPNLTDAYRRRAQFFIKSGAHAKAIADLDAVLKADPFNVEVLLRRAISREQAGLREEALADYRAILAIESTNKSAKEAVRRLQRAEADRKALLSPPPIAERGAPESSPETHWSHNGSVMKLAATGASRHFYYEQPTLGILKQGVKRGTLLFDGTRSGSTYSGTARIFSRQCGTFRYKVAGTVGEDQKSLTLFGKAPRLTKSCIVAGYRDDILYFNLLKPGSEQSYGDGLQ